MRERIREALVPRKGWRRRARYLARRLARLSATPHAIALGFAIGAFSAFTPFLGLHVIIGLTVAAVLRANLVAAALGTVVANPLTLPFIFAGTWEAGRLILAALGHPVVEVGAPALGQGLVAAGWRAVWPVLEPMAVGSLPLGLAAAVAGYVLVLTAVRSLKERRRPGGIGHAGGAS